MRPYHFVPEHADICAALKPGLTGLSVSTKSGLYYDHDIDSKARKVDAMSLVEHRLQFKFGEKELAVTFSVIEPLGKVYVNPRGKQKTEPSTRPSIFRLTIWPMQWPPEESTTRYVVELSPFGVGSIFRELPSGPQELEKCYDFGSYLELNRLIISLINIKATTAGLLPKAD